MSAAIVLSRTTENMAGFNHMELDEVHTPSSDYSYSHASMIPNASGMFPLSQTGPADLGGSTWDATPAEGPQNFPEYSDHVDYYTGDAEDYSLTFGQITPKQDRSDAVDDLNDRWTPVGHWATATAVETKAMKAEPMSRVASKSSNTSHKSRAKASSKKTRSRVQSILASQASQLSNLEVTGNYHDGGQIVDVQQYLARDSDTLSVSSHVTAPTFYPGMVGMGPEGLYHGDMASMMAGHVNPQIFDMGLTSQSPQSWGSQSPVESRISSPGVPEGIADDLWSSGVPVPSPPDTLESSPPDSYSSESPILSSGATRMSETLNGSHFVTSEDLHGTSMVAAGDDFSLPPAFNSRRLSGEGESARDHYLYKNVTPREDGLYHCPWEGEAQCNHKPEKLKCNYDKFVDSHLKPYRCKVEGCQASRFSSTACLLRHEREAHAMHGHGEKPYLCTHQGCERSFVGHGFPRQWNLRDHMKRVHNDNGQVISPPPAGSASSTRGRKRKGEVPTKQSSQDKTSSRKSSNASKSAVDSVARTPKHEELQVNPELDQWYEHQRSLSTLVNGFTQPDDAQFLQSFEEAQSHLEAMGRISRDLVATKNADLLRGPYRSWKQSG